MSRPSPEQVQDARARLASARGNVGSSKGPGWSGGAKSMPGRNNSLQEHANAQAKAPQSPPPPNGAGALPAPSRPSPTLSSPHRNASLQAHADAQRAEEYLPIPAEVDAALQVVEAAAAARPAVTLNVLVSEGQKIHVHTPLMVTRAEARQLAIALLQAAEL